MVFFSFALFVITGQKVKKSVLHVHARLKQKFTNSDAHCGSATADLSTSGDAHCGMPAASAVAGGAVALVGIQGDTNNEKH